MSAPRTVGAAAALGLLLVGPWAVTGCSDDVGPGANAEGPDAETNHAGSDAGDSDTDDLDADTGDFDSGDLDADMDTGDSDSGDLDAGGSDTDASNGDDPPSGLSEPCENGPGWTVFRFYYDDLSTSANIEVWDASCTYSLASGSACNVREVSSGFGDVPTTSDGYPIVDTSGNFVRIRYSVDDLDFQSAEVHLRARSYSTSLSTDFRLWSPLYGDTTGGPVSQSFGYDWYSADWTDYLSPSDDPDLTAIELYAASGGSSEIAVRSMELCVE